MKPYFLKYHVRFKKDLYHANKAEKYQMQNITLNRYHMP